MKTLVLTLAALALVRVSPMDQAHTLQNSYLKLSVRGTHILSMAIDPAGKSNYRPLGLLDMSYQGIEPTAQSRVVVSTASTLILAGLDALDTSSIEVANGHVPELLTPGHSIGQSFTVQSGTITSLQACLPTWATKDSGATLSLRKGSANGPVVASRKLEKVHDNSWQSLAFDPQGPGTYVVQLSDAHGKIGWWSSRDKRYAGGSATRDGKPDATMERTLKVSGTRPAGTASLTLDLNGPRLRTKVAVTPASGQQAGSRPLLVRLKWNNEGYDCTAAAVPFYRFFTDTFRYMPTQQLKRWKGRDGHYALSFGAHHWIEADGTGNADLRFVGQSPSLAWLLKDKEATLIFGAAPHKTPAETETALAVDVLPRGDHLPASWPRFVTPNPRDGEDATTFFYERAFTYGPTWGPAAWFEWNPIARSWQCDPGVAQIGKMLATYPMSPQGYVNSWGAAPGWPFPDNTKYDTRHGDTNARFILGCLTYAAWTGDIGFLKSQAERLRLAMQFQLTVQHGADGLIIAPSKDATGLHEAYCGDNYWDITPFGHLDAFANIVWYASIGAMRQIEQMLSAAGGVKTKTPPHTLAFYDALQAKARRAYTATFWNNAAGRFIGCVDVDGKRHDYGFTYVNVGAMAHGLATKEQARRIYHWMETEPTSTGKADTYSAYIFAPRSNTIHDPRWDPKKGKLDNCPQAPWWTFGWRGTAYGDVQCQDGGAILYTSYFDLLARLKLLGADNAWHRWEAIVGRWRMPDHLVGGSPLYRGEHPQQINAGATGTDIPFPESGLVPCWFLTGLAGVQPTSRGLVIAPKLPSSMPWLEIRNVAYHGLPLTIRVTPTDVTLRCDATGYKFTWTRKLGADGSVLFTAPPAPIHFPSKPLWSSP